MEFSFHLKEAQLPPGLSIWDKSSIGAIKGDAADKFKMAIDAMAVASGKAQNLKMGISTVGRLVMSDYTLYVLVDDTGTKLQGILKMGKKHLYLVTPKGNMVETDPLCVMDFYVHQSCQRQGVGIKLFKMMLQEEGVEAHQLAYDRPSPKLLPFLQRHFGLKFYTRQPNHFVVFDEYFSGHVLDNKRETPRNNHKPAATTVPTTIGQAMELICSVT